VSDTESLINWICFVWQVFWTLSNIHYSKEKAVL